MKLGLYLVKLLGLICLCASSSDVSKVSDEAQGEGNEKRFSAGSSNFVSPGEKAGGLVDWSSAFNKRSPEFKPSSFGGSEKYVDWSKLFKRFHNNNGAVNFGNGQNGADLVDWQKAFAKRFGANPADMNEQKLVDWSSAFKKRFGHESATPIKPNLVDWSTAFSKRSKRAADFKRIGGGSMHFGPDAFRSSDLVDWSKMFKRNFGGASEFGNNANLQDWRNMFQKRRFGASYNGDFEQDGLTPYELQNWNLY